jgi:putative hydrolase of the HAD superfamily
MLRTVPFSEEILRSLQTVPGSVIPTGMEPKLQILPGIRAVLFDIYGTLLVSGAGDMEDADANRCEDAMPKVLGRVGISTTLPGAELWGQFQEILQGHQDCLRAGGIGHPEVEIRSVWIDFVKHISGSEPSLEDASEMALFFECLANPVALMPGAKEVLGKVAGSSLDCGLVSNAQFYTKPVLEHCMGATLESLGIPGYLTAFSFEFLEGKPGSRMFRYCAKSLAELEGIQAHETLYVGNDRLNDLYPASQIGFRTALFAGDARSLRLREEDPRCKGQSEDLVLTSLNQLANCLLGL